MSLFKRKLDKKQIIKTDKKQVVKEEIETKEQLKIPEHVAIIMDGNGRWAKKRHLPRNMGHREGANTLKKILKDCSNFGIRYVTVYAFSTENWVRSKEEVNGIMNLLLEFLKRADEELAGNDIRIRVIGDITPLSDEIKKEIAYVENKTKNNKEIDLIIALNYGGRNEIVEAAKKIAGDVKEGKLNTEDINEELIKKYIYTYDIPDPDLVIRPSGEQRLSNFLIWQSAYSEFWFSDVLWPDFKREDLHKAIVDYTKRDRRFGGVK